MSSPEPALDTPEPDLDFVSSVLLDAPPEEVFEAYADPALLARWWGPEGFTNTFHEFDFRPGGRWRFDMHGPDGATFPNESVFVEIDHPSRLVIEHVCAPRFKLLVTLTRRGGMTELVWRMRHETNAQRERLRALITRANEENFDRLGRLLFERAEAKVAPR
jgi:uncharacterized protein YndB with AHSA1/START domain